MELIGWLGSVLLALCALPETARTISRKKCNIGMPMLVLWFIGEIFLLAFEFNDEYTVQRVTNYLANIAMISVMIYYRSK